MKHIMNEKHPFHTLRKSSMNLVFFSKRSCNSFTKLAIKNR